jgi:hypothetical protein
LIINFNAFPILSESSPPRKSDEPENMFILEGNQGKNASSKIKELEDQLHEKHVLENKTLSKKRERILTENNDIPSNEEQVIEMAKALKASQFLLEQKSFDGQKSEEMIHELNIRLELEHDRRVRAQEEIGEIEKERMVIQNDLQSKNMECVKKSEENDELKLDCDYKIGKYTSEIQRLESKLENIILEKDKRILDLQSQNNELYLKLNVLEDRYNKLKFLQLFKTNSN